jgi:hypothetical protein
MSTKYAYQAKKITVSATSTQKLFGANSAKSCDFRNNSATAADEVQVWFGLNPWYLDFDETDDVVDFGSTIAATVAAATDGRIHLGVLIDSAGTGARTILSVSDANTETAFWLKVDTNDKLEASLVVAGTAQWTWTSTEALTLDEWHELAVFHDGVAPVFVWGDDGQLPGSFSVSTDKTAWMSSLTGIDTFNLGALDYNSAGNADWFNGGIDFVKVYSGKNTVDSELSLDFYCKIDEGTATTLDDEQSANNGTITSATWTAKQGVYVDEDTGRIFHNDDDPGFKDGIWVTNGTGNSIAVTGKLGKQTR